MFSLGVYVWGFVINGYNALRHFSMDVDVEKEYEIYAKARHVILIYLSKGVSIKIMHCKSSQEVWNKLRNIYQYNDGVKETTIKSNKIIFHTSVLDCDFESSNVEERY